MQFSREHTCNHCGVESTWTDLNCPACGKYYAEGVATSVDLQATTIFHHDEYGLGVCATKNLKPRTLIESAPAFLQDRMEYTALTQGMSFHSSRQGAPIRGVHLWLPWFFEQVKAMAVGKAMIFNHSFDPNLVYFWREDAETGRYFIDFMTTRDVRENEELTISYGNEVWFPPYTKAAWDRNERIRKKREASEEKEREALKSRK